MSFANQEELVEKYKPMVIRIARDVAAQTKVNVELDDLISWGMTGLLECAQRFDPMKGVKFSTFSWYRIRGAIYDGVRDSSNFGKSGLRAMEHLDEYMSVKSDTPDSDVSVTDSFIALAQGISSIMVMKNIDDCIDIADDAETPEEISINKSRNELLFKNIDILPPSEKMVLEEHYFKGRSMKEIAEERGRSKSWASRVHARAIDFLKEKLTQQ